MFAETELTEPDLEEARSQRSGYNKRAMLENASYRYKTMIGRGVRSRTLAGQRVEVQLSCELLNTIAHLGMPDHYRVA